MRITLIILCCLFANFQLQAQNADCDKMLILKDTIYHTKAISGFGVKKEFGGNELENDKAFEKERNSIWYFITAPVDGIFTFDIITENKSDDWDFLLFEYKKMFCKRVEDKVIVPIRSNLSRSPITGLSRKGKASFVGAGVNDNYSRPIRVKKGNRYVLVVNNPKRSGGTHTLLLHFPTKKKTEAVVKEVEVEKQVEHVVQKTVFILSVKDADTKKAVASNVTISGLTKEVIMIDSVDEYKKEVSKKNRTVNIVVSAKGYMLAAVEHKVKNSKLEVNVEVLLEPIVKGKKVNLKNLQFFGNRPDFLPGARSSLDALLSFMKSNPKVVIEVEGHVNGPGQKNSQEYKDLSYSRAYAVKGYLIKKGIDKERIDFKGYGNSQMLYPNPKSEYQQSANRRVEIKILSNEYSPGNRNFH